MRCVTKSLDELKHSLTATDTVVTALYAELVQTRPNIRDRLHALDSNLAKGITITPGAGELRQPIYDAGDQPLSPTSALCAARVSITNRLFVTNTLPPVHFLI